MKILCKVEMSNEKIDFIKNLWNLFIINDFRPSFYYCSYKVMGTLYNEKGENRKRASWFFISAFI